MTFFRSHPLAALHGRSASVHADEHDKPNEMHAYQQKQTHSERGESERFSRPDDRKAAEGSNGRRRGAFHDRQ